MKVVRKEIQINGTFEYFEDGTLKVTDRFNNVKLYNSFEDYTNKNKFDSKSTLDKALSNLDKQFSKK